MKKEVLLEFLKRIKKSNFKIEDRDIHELLSLDEETINSILLLDNDLLKSGIEIACCKHYDSNLKKIHSIEFLKTIKNKEKIGYITSVLTKKDIIKANLVDDAVSLLNASPKLFNLKYATLLLTNVNAIRNNIALEGAKIINDSDTEFNAKYAYYTLTDKNTIYTNTAIEGAKIINRSPREFNAKYAFDVLTNYDMLKNNIALKGARIINNSQDLNNTLHAYKVLTNTNAIEAGIALRGAKIINKSLYEFQTPYIVKVLTNKDLIENDMAIEGAKIIKESHNEFNASCVCKILTNEDVLKTGYCLKYADIINNIKLGKNFLDNKEYMEFVYAIITNNLDIPLEEVEKLFSVFSEEVYLPVSYLGMGLNSFITEQLHKEIEIEDVLKIIYKEHNFINSAYSEIDIQNNKLDNIINYLDTIKADDIDINTIINSNIIKPKSKVKKI